MGATKKMCTFKKSENGAKTYIGNCSNYPKCVDSENIGGLDFQYLSKINISTS